MNIHSYPNPAPVSGSVCHPASHLSLTHILFGRPRYYPDQGRSNSGQNNDQPLRLFFTYLWKLLFRQVVNLSYPLTPKFFSCSVRLIFARKQKIRSKHGNCILTTFSLLEIHLVCILLYLFMNTSSFFALSNYKM